MARKRKKSEPLVISPKARNILATLVIVLVVGLLVHRPVLFFINNWSWGAFFITWYPLWWLLHLPWPFDAIPDARNGMELAYLFQGTLGFASMVVTGMASFFFIIEGIYAIGGWESPFEPQKPSGSGTSY